MEDYHYPLELIQVEDPIKIGSNSVRADIVIYNPQNKTEKYIIVELKKPKEKEGREQLKSYLHSTGAPIGVWSNGNQQEFYHRTDPNHLNSLSYLPYATLSFEEILDQLDKITILKVLRGDKLNTKTLKEIIEQLEDEVLANSGVDVFEESFKPHIFHQLMPILHVVPLDRI